MTIHQTAILQAGSPAEQRFLDLYNDVAERLPGNQSADVRAWRDEAVRAFLTLGLPHRRVEEWKYTDLRVLMQEVYPLAGLNPQAMVDVSLASAIGPELAALDTYSAVFVNGRYRADLSTITEAKGVSFLSSREALSDAEPAGKAVAVFQPVEGDVVSALGAAFATDGAMIAIEAGAVLDKPLHLVFITAGDSPVATGLQNAVRLGEGAQATIIETHASLLPSQSFAVNHVEIGPDAHLRHVRLNFGKGQGVKHLSTIAAKLGKGSQYDPLQVTIGGALTRAQAYIRYDGEGGRCHFTGASMLRGQEHSDMTLLVDHAVPECESRELAKAVLDGRARGVFQAKVLVRPGAQKTDGKQMSNALLLSDEAEFDSKPELEIYADDVVCGHGATTGQLDEDMMFYLRARGLPEAQARALLIVAFIGEVFDTIEDEALREALQAQAGAWLSA